MELTEIIKKVKMQDRAAFEELYNSYYQMGFSLSLQFVRNEEDALDIMQDVFITVYSKIDSLESASKFKSWYMQIVANKCRDYLKKKKPLSFTEANAYDEEGTLQFDTETTYREFIPEEAIDYSETVRIVDQMIAELPEEQRLCILLYFANDMSIPEIANSLEISEATVKSRIKYAKNKIRAKTEDYEKKTGTKLYGLGGLMFFPFIRWALVQNAVGLSQAPTGTFASIFETISYGSGSIPNTTATISHVAKSGSNIIQKISSLSATQKVIGGVVAGALVVGSATAVALPKSNKKDHRTSSVAHHQQMSTIPIDWQKYINAEYSGFDGEATVWVKVNFTEIDTLVGTERIQEFLTSNNLGAEEPSFSSLLDFSVSYKDKLSNGDKITVILAPTEKLILAGISTSDISSFFGIDIDSKTVLTVEGLEVQKEIDFLTLIKDHIIYEGENGNAYAYLNFPSNCRQTITDRIFLEFSDTQAEVFVDNSSVGTIEITLLAPSPESETVEDLEFIYCESGPLSNGDVLTIELGNYYQEEISKRINPLGFSFKRLSYKFIVSGL